jgi:hypothetical protein
VIYLKNNLFYNFKIIHFVFRKLNAFTDLNNLSRDKDDLKKSNLDIIKEPITRKKTTVCNNSKNACSLNNNENNYQDKDHTNRHLLKLKRAGK